MNNSVLGKYCVVTIGHMVSKIGEIKKVNSRTIHVDWGSKVMIYTNKDFAGYRWRRKRLKRSTRRASLPKKP